MCIIILINYDNAPNFVTHVQLEKELPEQTDDPSQTDIRTKVTTYNVHCIQCSKFNITPLSCSYTSWFLGVQRSSKH